MQKVKMKRVKGNGLTLSLVLGVAIAFGASGQIEAAVEQKSVTEESASTEKAKQKTGENIDEEITNDRLRASSGSKSIFSFSTDVAYQGGSVSEPLSSSRPNIYGDPENETLTSVGGDFALRGRLTSNDSLRAGTGFALLAPTKGSLERERGDVSNPYVGYTRAGKVAGFQSLTEFDLTYGTRQSWDQINRNFQPALSQTVMRTVGTTGLTLGGTVSALYNFYTNSAGASDRRLQWQLGFYPQAEYQFNDTFTARTVFGYFNWKNRREMDALELSWGKSYQSVGLGISATRDLYFYPNVQFLPGDIEAKKTNVALSATMNFL